MIPALLRTVFVVIDKAAVFGYKSLKVLREIVSSSLFAEGQDVRQSVLGLFQAYGQKVKLACLA